MSERNRHSVSMALDNLGAVAEQADVGSGRWNEAFSAAWVEIDALVAAETADLRAHAARLEERLGVVRGVLKSVEWGGWDDLTGRTCPECEAPYDRLKHSPGCALLAALGEGEG